MLHKQNTNEKIFNLTSGFFNLKAISVAYFKNLNKTQHITLTTYSHF